MQVRGEFSHMGCPWAVRAAVRPLRSEPERRLLDPLAVEAHPASARARALARRADGRPILRGLSLIHI